MVNRFPAKGQDNRTASGKRKSCSGKPGRVIAECYSEGYWIRVPPHRSHLPERSPNIPGTQPEDGYPSKDGIPVDGPFSGVC